VDCALHRHCPGEDHGTKTTLSASQLHRSEWRCRWGSVVCTVKGCALLVLATGKPFRVPIQRLQLLREHCYFAKLPFPLFGGHARADGTGRGPIETIRPGDRVLSQNQDTGELAYKVVLTKTLRPPTEMVRIQVKDENVVTTLGHPFWVVGHGWKMAKELKEGDLLHRLDGATRITAMTSAPEAAAHNLVVDEFNTYFVGETGLLVHDNEFRKPTRSTVPGMVLD
jgi:hypothetical protein